MAATDDASLECLSRSSSAQTTRKRSLSEAATDLVPPSLSQESSTGDFDDVPLASPADDLRISGVGAWNGLDNVPALRLTHDGMDTFRCVLHQKRFSDHVEHVAALDFVPLKPEKPFQKWMRSLRKRALQRHSVLSDAPGLHGTAQTAEKGLNTRKCRGHRQSSSGSSFGFVRHVRSASISLSNVSVLGRSRRTTLQSSRGHARTDRNSRASLSGTRYSEDSSCPEKSPLMDKDALERSLQRRRILEELISTEEGYIGDVRFLMNVYVTILVSLPTLPAKLRSSINQNLADIVELHEEMLGELHRAVPHSEYTQLDVRLPAFGHVSRGHQRWRSLDAVPEDKEETSWLQAIPGMLTEPQIAAEVSKVFNKKMSRFFLYEEYGAKYETMMKDIGSAHRTLPQWETYQRGLEALASSLDSAAHSCGDLAAKKSLTIGDLLVKPIQRVCKYPLLFAELLKYTPVSDCPHSHMEIENTLARLREATSAINRATDGTHIKAVLERTWLLQDRLVFPDQRLDAASKSRIRSFGHVQLCGVLHICWQSKDGFDGQYMINLLYRDWLCLASASKVDQIYTLRACIPLAHVRLEAADNGRGLQCHTAPFSWKLVFEFDCQLYELVMTACTPREGAEWRSRLAHALARDRKDQTDSSPFGSLSLNIKSLGTVFGKQGTVARRLSIHRATTVGPKSPLCQVILKNTSVEKDPSAASSTSPINRSQSLLTTNNRIPVLTPSRADRARLEALLSDVWTREVLPFPGMTTRARSEHLVRTSASSMIRKLSVASIASTFTRKSASTASTSKTVAGETDCLTDPNAPQAVNEAPRLEVIHALDETLASRLSIIDDESGQQSPRTTAVSSNEALTNDGTIRQSRVSRAQAAWHLEELSAGLPALRTSSPNSLRMSRQVSEISRHSPCPSDKENVPRTSRDSRKPSSHKLSSKWVKVEALRRGVVAQGFRNLFR